MKTTSFALLSASLVITGCASVTGSSNQSLSVQTRTQAGKEVVGAACELSNNKGKWFITTPGSVSIHRSNDDMQVLCNKEGFDPGRAAVVSDTKGSMFGNIILGGGIGAIIDHNNGAAYEYPNFIQVIMGTFTKFEPPKPTEAAANGNNAQSAPQQTGQAAAVSTKYAENSPAPLPAPTKEQKLEELKGLFDKGLITREAYIDQQKAILSGQY